MIECEHLHSHIASQKVRFHLDIDHVVRMRQDDFNVKIDHSFIDLWVLVL